MIRSVLAAVVLTFGSLTFAQDAGKHPFSVHDMQAMERISDPQVAPDGKAVVFVVRKTDLEANKGRTDLWRIAIDGSGLKQLTSHEASESNPRWSPDGKWIYFLTTREESTQVWRMASEGGELEQVTKQPLDVSAFVVSPDGLSLAIAMDVFPGTSPAETKTRLEERKKRKATGRVYDKLMVRHWDSWKDGLRSHVFAVPVWGGEAMDVMKEMNADCPSKPFGGPEEFSYAPDNEAIVFTAKNADREEAWSTNFDLFSAPIDGSSPPVNLTDQNNAWDTGPVFSPMGRLAYLAMSRPGYEADRFQIMVKASPAANNLSISKDWDRSPGTIAWSADESTIYAAADNVGQHSLFEVNVATNAVKTIVQEGHISAVAVAGDRLVILMDHLKGPAELYTVKPDGSELKQITKINDEKIAKAQMGDFEQFNFKGWHDETVYGFAVKPVDFDASKKYPVAFLIHGGPQGSFGNHFHYRWNPQAYAGAGYGVVMVDFHGSTGYGQAFSDSIRGDWGGKPLEDLKKGLEAAVAKYSWLDGERVGALGASYGGYMINWIAGNWPDRFKCLVCHDGNLCERMAYYDTEELWFPEWDHIGTPWENPENYEKHNPINHVKNWKTPMLVIHGALDYRVVDTQGIATFTALQRRGIPSKFLHFPDENHWVLKPANSILWHETVIGWLDQWTKK
jgi:dipeptidyl aminopeptidase/acylaminoacyl peptidase